MINREGSLKNLFWRRNYSTLSGCRSCYQYLYPHQYLAPESPRTAFQRNWLIRCHCLRFLPKNLSFFCSIPRCSHSPKFRHMRARYIDPSWSSLIMLGLGLRWQPVVQVTANFDPCTGNLRRLCWVSNCHRLWSLQHDDLPFISSSTRAHYRACDHHSGAQLCHLCKVLHDYLLHSNNKSTEAW